MSLISLPPVQERVITQDTVLEKEALLNVRIVIKADHVTLDGNGATLVGPGEAGKPATFQGTAVSVVGCSQVTIRNLKAKGFANGIVGENGTGWLIENCDLSDNYHDPEFGWGNGPRQGGIILTGIRQAIIRRNQANRVWNGLDLDHCDDNQITENDFSHCSNVCLKMQTSSRNLVTDNNLSYGIRIKPGEVHARDSTSVLIESGSNDNKFFRNDITHGGDGVFIRVLNNWVSTGNLFVENDCSHANNNCFEAWSPGNTYIRNKANHGSYGFWLGASDQTVLIGNEAAYNGQPDGNHNAPESDFRHGGIVFVGGPSSHTLVSGNHCHHNAGGGIVLRGDLGTKGAAWKAFHWIIQNNRLENNRWGIFARFADWVHLANNTSLDNAEADLLEQVTNLTRGEEKGVLQAPRAVLLAPKTTTVGQAVVFDASESSDPAGRPLSYRFDLGDGVFTEAKVTHTFTRPGFYRVGLTVSNGVLADLAYRDLIVTAPVTETFGTEGQAAAWGYEIEGDPKAKLLFADDPDAVAGRFSLRFVPAPYPGSDVTAFYPAAKNAGWNLTGKKTLSFWIKAQNPNPTGFQDAGPVVHLYGTQGKMTYTPASGKNPIREGGYSEARWTWQRLEIPLEGSADWKRETQGTVSLNAIQALGFTFDSWEASPFTVWLDGIALD